MSDFDDDMDDERAAIIDEGIDQMHRFLRNLIDDPTPLQLIPDGSELQFRTVQIGDEVMQMTAHRPDDSDEPWTARVTSCEPVESFDGDAGHLPERDDATPNGHRTSRCAAHLHQLVRVAPTSQAALDAVEAVVLSPAAQVTGS